MWSLAVCALELVEGAKGKKHTIFVWQTRYVRRVRVKCDLAGCSIWDIGMRGRVSRTERASELALVDSWCVILSVVEFRYQTNGRTVFGVCLFENIYIYIYLCIRCCCCTLLYRCVCVSRQCVLKWLCAAVFSVRLARVLVWMVIIHTHTYPASY